MRAAGRCLALVVTVALSIGVVGLVQSAQALATGGTSYYVDSVAGNDANSGTNTSAPWRSLAKVNATSFAPGDSVLFNGGSTWTGSLTITSSGTSSAPITVGSYGTGRPRVNANTSATSAIMLSNVHDVVLNNFEVTNSSNFTASTTTIYRGIYVQAEDTGQMPGIVIENNYVHNVDGEGRSGGIGNGGIAVGVRGNTTQTWFSGLQILNNEVANINAYGISTFTTWCASCEIYSEETGIPSSEVSPTRVPYAGVLISGNHVHDVTGGGITPQYADNAVVQYNTVDRAASHQLVAGGGNVGIWWQGTNGILVQYNTVRHTAVDGEYSNGDAQAFDADMDSTHSTVQFNISDSNTGGFFFCYFSSYNNQVRYNLSVNDTRVVFRLLGGCGNTRAYNNTIVGTTRLTPTLTAPGVPGTPAAMEGITLATDSSHTVVDNVFYNPAHASYYPSGRSNISYSHNLYWDGTSGGTVTPANDPATTVADPRLTDTSASLPAGGLITPAQFQTYFQGFVPTASSPVFNKGVSEFGQTADALGDQVPVGATDLGAIQHTVTATATTTLGTSIGTVANIADGDPATSWASSNSPSLPGKVTIQYSDPRTFDAVTVAAAFGQGQGPTSVDVQTWTGSAWVTAVAAAALTWHQNTTNVEYAKIQLPATVTTSLLRLVTHAANLTWGHLAIYEISASNQAVAATDMGELSPGNNAAALVDNNPATSWASASSTLGYLQIDSPTATASSITLQVAFGQGQGPTSIFVQALNGDNGSWQTVVPTTAVSWSSNTSTVESRTITFSAPITATRFEVQIDSANLTWGHVALNGVSVS
jgi:hypothetical protein